MDGLNQDVYRKSEHEWAWETNDSPQYMVLSDQNSLVTFHPKNSTGTAIIRGNKPFVKGRHYYWEIKLLTRPYGTDIMVGVGTKNVNLQSLEGNYCSFLGKDKETWGLSYLGVLHHNGQLKTYAPLLCKGTTIGMHLDTWRGTLQYFIDKIPLGIAFVGLRNLELYPMACSTAAASKIKIVRCLSEPVSLQMDCLGILCPYEKIYLETSFPFLQYLSRSVFANILQKKLSFDKDGYCSSDEEDSIL